MGVYGSPEFYPINNNRKPVPEKPIIERKPNLQKIPTMNDYLKWFFFPALLGVVTFGIGSIILMILWAADNRNLARANFFKAIFASIWIIISVGIAILITAFVMTNFILN